MRDGAFETEEQMSDSCKVERTSRQVIERKLLDALSDESSVAILASKQELEDMISALEYSWSNSNFGGLRHRELALGMRQLLSEAFPEPSQPKGEK